MCIFCDKIADRHFLCENTECVAFYDEFPVTEGHILIVPKVHTPNFITLTPDEFECINEMVLKMVGEMEAHDNTITGWNICWEIGKDAGQLINHCYCHVIPRRKDDGLSLIR